MQEGLTGFAEGVPQGDDPLREGPRSSRSSPAPLPPDSTFVASLILFALALIVLAVAAVRGLGHIDEILAVDAGVGLAATARD